MLWKLSLKILTPYCQTCKKEDLLWETSTTHSQLPYSKIQSRYSNRAAYSDLKPLDGGQSLYPMSTVIKLKQEVWVAMHSY